MEPYRLVHSSFRWYLLAWDTERAAWRTFRVDRIGPRPRAGRAFQPRPLPSTDLADYVAKSVAGISRQWRARVTIEAPADQVKRRMLWVQGHLEPRGPDRTEVEAAAESLETLGLWLGHLGWEFKVHEPPALVEYLRNLSARLHRGT